MLTTSWLPPVFKLLKQHKNTWSPESTWCVVLWLTNKERKQSSPCLSHAPPPTYTCPVPPLSLESGQLLADSWEQPAVECTMHFSILLNTAEYSLLPPRVHFAIHATWRALVLSRHRRVCTILLRGSNPSWIWSQTVGGVLLLLHVTHQSELWGWILPRLSLTSISPRLGSDNFGLSQFALTFWLDLPDFECIDSNRSSGFCGEFLLALALAIMTCVGWIATLQHGQGAECPQSSGRTSQLCTLYKFWISLFGIPKKITALFHRVWIAIENVGFIPPLFFLALQSPPTTRENKMRIYLFGFGIGRAGSKVKLILDLLGGIFSICNLQLQRKRRWQFVRQHVLSLPFPLFVFCIFCCIFVVLYFVSLPGRGRGGDNPWDTVSYLVLSHSHSGEQHLREIQGNDGMYHITYIWFYSYQIPTLRSNISERSRVEMGCIIYLAYYS